MTGEFSTFLTTLTRPLLALLAVVTRVFPAGSAALALWLELQADVALALTVSWWFVARLATLAGSLTTFLARTHALLGSFLANLTARTLPVATELAALTPVFWEVAGPAAGAAVS